VTIDLRETRIKISSNLSEINLGEIEWGEVETPEARRAKVIYSFRSTGYMRQHIAYIRRGEKATQSRGTPEVDPHCRMRGMFGARSLTSEEKTLREKELECLELPNTEVPKKIIIFNHEGCVALDL